MRQKQHDIYTILLEGILSGTYRRGSLLPAEDVLAKQNGVSRPTIAKIYNRLQDEGYIEKRRGHGSQIVYEQVQVKISIGLLLPGSGESEIFNIINDALLHVATKHGVEVIWGSSAASNAENRKSQIEADCERFIQQRVGAILFSPLERLPESEVINLRIFEKITGANIPLIFIDRSIDIPSDMGGYDTVWLDNYAAGRSVAQHLLDQGCDTVYFFHRPDSANSVALRLAGVRSAVLDNAYSFTHRSVFCGDPADLTIIKKMKILPGRTGIVCANDSTAAVLLASLDALELKPSRDYLIAGFDNMKYAQYLKSPLTTYAQPCEEMASVSLELALRRIKNNSHLPLSVTLNGKRIERESTKFRSKPRHNRSK